MCEILHVCLLHDESFKKKEDALEHEKENGCGTIEMRKRTYIEHRAILADQRVNVKNPI